MMKSQLIKTVKRITGLLLAAVLLLSLAGCGGGQTGGTEAVTKKGTEEQTQQEGSKDVSPNADTSAPQPSESESLTEPAPSETAPEEESVSEELMAAAFAAYREQLEAEEESIKAYFWQQLRVFPEGVAIEPQNEPRPIVVADICGNDLPELIYVHVTQEEPIALTTLEIMGYDAEQGLFSLYSGEWDFTTDGSLTYFMYQPRGEKTLRAAYSDGGNDWSEVLVSFEEERGEDGRLKLVPAELARVDYQFDGMTGNSNAVRYVVEGRDSDEKEYSSYMYVQMPLTVQTILMNSKRFPANRMELRPTQLAAMTWDDAILYLSEQND